VQLLARLFRVVLLRSNRFTSASRWHVQWLHHFTGTVHRSITPDDDLTTTFDQRTPQYIHQQNYRIVMPPKRRSQVSRTSSTGQQSTLSFHGKQQNKVTKRASPQQIKAAKKDPSFVQDVIDLEDESVTTPTKPTAAEKAIQQQTEQEATTLDTVPDPLDLDTAPTTTEDVLGGRAEQSDAGAVGGKGSGWVADEEQQARKVNDSQIKRYWRQKEQERLAPRVHQEDIGVYEKVLREWDMSGQYGVCR